MRADAPDKSLLASNIPIACYGGLRVEVSEQAVVDGTRYFDVSILGPSHEHQQSGDTTMSSITRDTEHPLLESIRDAMRNLAEVNAGQLDKVIPQLQPLAVGMVAAYRAAEAALTPASVSRD